jgi:hypothetical protein
MILLNFFQALGLLKPWISHIFLNNTKTLFSTIAFMALNCLGLIVLPTFVIQNITKVRTFLVNKGVLGSLLSITSPCEIISTNQHYLQ